MEPSTSVRRCYWGSNQVLDFLPSSWTGNLAAGSGMAIIFKICKASEWHEALCAGAYRGSTVDVRDGYIHFSTAAQVAETAARHFAGQSDLVLVAVDAESLGDELKWEPSRGGALFPHLYGPLLPHEAARIIPLPLGPDGNHLFPPLA